MACRETIQILSETTTRPVNVIRHVGVEQSGWAGETTSFNSVRRDVAGHYDDRRRRLTIPSCKRLSHHGCLAPRHEPVQPRIPMQLSRRPPAAHKAMVSVGWNAEQKVAD